ncbi:alpha/beta fold hydrolase [Planotetraspora sp. A-T 1434]|uniref:alpha/beta fold hydrolase n=1 Tax=Planotetraspora sp. A-T 1434 TaxID=2979219 RepID=UPI0021C221B7|nr:alpha/beta fold hydrolase [Planotetraspora sp. A-T 1434]MCT9929273.1 alpha/beta fold hydrolase [Planotetraspora sp. A-T 1434]
MEHRIPRFTLDGVRDAEVSVHPFATEDGLGLTLTRFRRAGFPAVGSPDDVVLLVHGLTSSSDMFIMPEHLNLVRFLHDSGFGDVWALDFRMSNRFPYNVETRRHTLDDIAQYDHPAALRELRRHVGARRIHVVAHCLGSVSFHMSLFSGAVDGIASLVANSVGLTPRVHRWARLKLAAGPVLLEYGTGLPYLDPRFRDAPPFTRRWLLARAVSLFHPECGEAACHMQSFMWGSGRPAMYRHGNLRPETHVHERLADLNGACDVNYYRHVRKMVAAGRVVKFDPAEPRHAALPDDYLVNAADVDTPILYLTGDHNDVFTDSNIVCHEVMSKAAPGRHELRVLPGYGHIDPLIGKDAHMDVFPHILDFLKRH